MTVLAGGTSPVTAVRRAPEPLAAFNAAGVLEAADVHVALRLGTLGATTEPAVLLALAMAVRAPRLGHVCVDLATVRSTVSTEAEERPDLSALPWPDATEWVAALSASPLVGPDQPLRLEGSALYLDRYWAAECQVAADLLARAGQALSDVDADRLRADLDVWFDPAGSQGGPDLQRLAAATAVLRGLSVIAGGPGTGKTTTVARVLALLWSQAAGAGRRPPLVALAAPTGKAAARLEEAIQGPAQEPPSLLAAAPGLAEWLLGLRGQTIHRLLGWSPNRTRFAHHRLNHLPHDVVVVDETSMVDLPLMGRLVEAVRPDSRLVLVGDPEQLASVEAGAVLGDLVGPAGTGLRMNPRARAALAEATGQQPPATPPDPPTPIGDGIVVLRRVHRFGGAMGELARAVQAGQPDDVLEVLGGGDPAVRWVPGDLAADPDASAQLRRTVVAGARAITDLARAGQGREALAALGEFRLLCAHRRGPDGAQTWTERIESWLAAALGPGALEGQWYPGRPLLVTANDYALQLFNGDTGVVLLAAGERTVAAFERGGDLLEVSPARLAAVETVYAMTVHKAQGSQFGTVAVVLPSADSPVLTRELLYTAITRGQRAVVVAGTEASVRTAVDRPIARSSGLGRRLWQPRATDGGG